MKLYIDYGGTHFRYLIKRNHEIVSQKVIDSDKVDLIDFLETKLTELEDIDFIGISFAGQVKDGVILSSPNIDIKHKNIKEYIESKYKVRLEIENDLKCALLAEMDELGKDKSIVLFYIGTGFGSAYCEDGEIIRGVNNLAGEIGHIPYKKAPFKCGCGKDDCLELYVSGIGLKKWVDYYNLQIEPTLEALRESSLKEAKEILNNFYEGLAFATSSIVTILNPEYLILGGGVIKNNPDLLNFVQKEVSKKALNKSLKDLNISISRFENASLEGAEKLEKYTRKFYMSHFDINYDEKYSTKVAYFSMEFAIHQALKIYSGGLGFLAGSHMRSAYDLKQNVIGVGILWTYGYYDQVRREDGSMAVSYISKKYHFLEDPNVTVTVTVNGKPVFVKVYLLKPETFQSAPVVLLTTDIDQNDYLARTITKRLYDGNHEARIAQEIVLGIGGIKALEALGEEIDIYHMNEGHSIPLAFHLYKKYGSVDEVRKRLVFTTHTPEAAGNEEHNIHFLHRMGFFGDLDLDTVRDITQTYDDVFSLTLGALRLSKISNAVSKIHSKVANEMWGKYSGISKIIPITNAQNRRYWQDKGMIRALDENLDYEIILRKKHLKRMLFNVVADQTGKMFDPNVITIVWARRFAEYKRPGLLKYDFERFINLVTREKEPVQIIWAGKPYPGDEMAIDLFNELVYITKDLKRATVLTGYELELSAILKRGADVWLNTPRITREASGTSGMTASMNGALHFSIPDGWHPEFAKHGVNSFVIPGCDPSLPIEEQDRLDNKNMMDILENEIIPLYYRDQAKWVWMMKNAMKDIVPYFDSDRMAHEYYERMYNYKYLPSENRSKHSSAAPRVSMFI